MQKVPHTAHTTLVNHMREIRVISMLILILWRGCSIHASSNFPWHNYVAHIQATCTHSTYMASIVRCNCWASLLVHDISKSQLKWDSISCSMLHMQFHQFHSHRLYSNDSGAAAVTSNRDKIAFVLDAFRAAVQAPKCDTIPFVGRTNYARFVVLVD